MNECVCVRVCVSRGSMYLRYILYFYVNTGFLFTCEKFDLLYIKKKPRGWLLMTFLIHFSFDR